MASERERWQPGVIEFHCPKNRALYEEFFRVVTDLQDAACIMDIWLMDIGTILKRHGYEMTIYLREDG